MTLDTNDTHDTPNCLSTIFLTDIKPLTMQRKTEGARERCQEGGNGRCEKKDMGGAKRGEKGQKAGNEAQKVAEKYGEMGGKVVLLCPEKAKKRGLHRNDVIPASCRASSRSSK